MSIEKFNPRISGEAIPYTQVNNNVVQNMTNCEAFHVWAYLLSLPADWRVVKEHLKNHFGFGNQKIKKIFAYLHLCNLIEYTRARTAEGKMHKVEIRVLNGSRFNNVTEKKLVHTTGSEIHPVDNPPGGVWPTTNKTNNTNKQKTKNKHSCASQDAPSLFDEFWKEYPRNENRKRAKQIWDKRNLDPMANQIIEDVKLRKAQHSPWQGGKMYVPHPSTYLSGDRWNDEIIRITEVPRVKQNELRSTVLDFNDPNHPTNISNREYDSKLKRNSDMQPKGLGAYADSLPVGRRNQANN